MFTRLSRFSMPLSQAQRDIYLDAQIHPEKSTYSFGAFVEIDREIDDVRWEAAVRRAHATFEAPRLRILDIDGTIQQFVDDLAEPQIEFLQRDGDDAAVSRILRSLVKKPYDFTQPQPAFRHMLLRIGTRKTFAIVAASHALIDAFGAREYFKAIFSFYDGESLDDVETLALPALAEISKNFDLPETITYWESVARNILPTAEPQAESDEYVAGTMKLSHSESANIRSFCEQHDVRPSALFRAAYALLLDRQVDVDSPVFFHEIFSGRSKKSRTVVGCLFHAVPVVVDRRMINECSVDDLVNYCARYRRELGDRQYLSSLESKRIFPRGGLKYFLNYEPYAPLERLGGMPFDVAYGVDANEVHATVRDDGAVFEVTMHACHGAIDVQGFAERLAHVAKVLCDATLLRDVDVLTPTDRAQIDRWNDTEVVFAVEETVHSQIVARIRRSPERCAVRFDGCSLTYRELGEYASRVAAFLIRNGVRPSDIVAVALDRSLELAPALLGTLQVGAAYLPLDLSYPHDRLEFMIADSRAKVVLGMGAPRVSIPRGIRYLDLSDAEMESSEAEPTLANGDSAAYVIYTSGSTGLPKGVVNSNRGIVNRLAWMQSAYPLTEDDAVLQKTPTSFDVSVWEIFWPLIEGATLVIAPPDAHRDPHALASIFSRERITVAHFVPSMLRAFLDTQNETFLWLRRVFASGEALPSDTARDFLLRHPEVALENLYGPTEAAVDVTAWHCTLENSEARLPIGSPIANTTISIIDHLGREMPPGAIGEIFIGGVQVALGYIERPELTAQKFIGDPAVPGRRKYRTGDIGRWRHDGALDFFGRVDGQVKIRGFRIELGEIESTIRALSSIRDAVAVTVGEGEDCKLVAYVIADTFDEEKASAVLRMSLPEHMLPAAYVRLDALPLLPNGKLDRASLPAPTLHRSGSALPETETERELKQLFCEILALRNVFTDESFFKLGGHSLLATRLIARIRQRCFVEVPLRSVFEHPTIRELASVVESCAPCEFGTVTTAFRESQLPVTFAQERIWFLEQLSPTNAAYHFQTTFDITGPLDTAALERSIDEIICRHEIYRTTFYEDRGHLWQRIHAHKFATLPVIDLSTLAGEELQERMDGTITEEIAKPLPLTRLPLARWILFKISPVHHRLLQIEHHLVHDGWSINVFLKELVVLYRAFSEGKASPLSDLEVQFADFASWQRKRVASGIGERQLSYWRRQLADAPPLLTLVTDRPRPPVQSFRGNAIRFDLDAALCDRLRSLGRANDATLYMVMLSALNVLLWRYSGQRDISVGAGIANRTEPAVEALIGMILNTVTIRSRFEDDPSFIELLSRVRETTLDA
ncbi:MAG: amino acid adenylation domain-containing protein, partial [Vulcanimicrobiaceae bacterium]